MTLLLSFHNDPKIKEKYLARVRAHAEADEIVKGRYWQGGKGCAVGCTIHSASYDAYETELGIPRTLAHLEDRIFEGLRKGWSKTWPERFLKSIPVGADLSKVGWKFLHWLLLDPQEGCVRFSRPQDKPVFAQVGTLLADLAMGLPIPESAVCTVDSLMWAMDSSKWVPGEMADPMWAARTAEAAVAAAADSAEAAVATAADSAKAAVAMARTAEAAMAAATDSATWAADSAVWADAAGAAAFRRQGEKLLELMAQAPKAEVL